MMEQLIEWLTYHAQTASPSSQAIYDSVLKKIEELEL